MMPIQINDPEVEQRLQKEAARRGITAADYAGQILHQHLPESEHGEPAEAAQVVSSAPEEACVIVRREKRKIRFHRWVKSHDGFPQLAPQAFDRASFYELPPL